MSGKGDGRRPEAVKGAWDRNWDRVFKGAEHPPEAWAEMEAKLKRAVELSQRPDPAAKWQIHVVSGSVTMKPEPRSYPEPGDTPHGA